jgi:hypothetical protein
MIVLAILTGIVMWTTIQVLLHIVEIIITLLVLFAIISAAKMWGLI